MVYSPLELVVVVAIVDPSVSSDVTVAPSMTGLTRIMPVTVLLTVVSLVPLPLDTVCDWTTCLESSVVLTIVTSLPSGTFVVVSVSPDEGLLIVSTVVPSTWSSTCSACPVMICAVISPLFSL